MDHDRLKWHCCKFVVTVYLSVLLCDSYYSIGLRRSRSGGPHANGPHANRPHEGRSSIDRDRNYSPCVAIDFHYRWTRIWIGFVRSDGGYRIAAGKSAVRYTGDASLRVFTVRTSHPAEQAVGRGISRRDRSSGANRQPSDRGRTRDRHPGSAAWRRRAGDFDSA